MAKAFFTRRYSGNYRTVVIEFDINLSDDEIIKKLYTDELEKVEPSKIAFYTRFNDYRTLLGNVTIKRYYK